jgi:flagellar biosynthetic protein FliQ
MGIDQVVLLGRAMLEEVLILVGPVLAVAISVSLLVNVTGAALFLMMPWMWRHLATYTLVLLSDFRGCLR